jgi:serine/threonine protein kinase/tetratricopeptide (TPR) repeat protein
MHATSRKAKEIFVAALKLAPDQWDAHLAEACGDDDELRNRVGDLLHANAEAGSFLESPASGPVVTVDEPIREGPGTIIGPYKLLEQIGEGGFGLVFMAEQQQPVRRKVAVKILKRGMDTRQVIARFEAERQALALMDHPNIARVLDAGETASGRPHFVMELVKGVSITDYCDQNRLTTRERLELFVHVCQAVQHAHHKGIIHRDVKPSNVMVTLHDDVPVVKVIDFGIAKALGQQLTDKTLVTGFAQMVGTPLYMSPEQAGMSGLDVDTRSDIYSLGVLLYELLTGTTPFDKERLRAAGYDEMRRVIREEEPPKPSTRLSTLGQPAATVSERRQSDPKRLSQLFRGELDWIVMKTLEKDRNRRYETANGLAADVQRYLHDEPVAACPPSAWYRIRKFARRHKAGLRIAAAAALVLLLAVGGVTWALWDQAARRTELSERMAETERTVSAALIQTEQWRKQAGEAPSATSQEADAVLVLWRQAEMSLGPAESALRTGTADDGLRQRVLDERQQVEEQRAQAQRTANLLRDLDDARMTRSIWIGADWDYAGGSAKYAAAFAAYGLEVKPGRTEELARRIRAEQPAIREALIVALEDWRRTAAYANTAELANLVRAIAAAADNDPWRRQYRAAATAGDATALRALSSQARRLSLPPSSLELLAASLRFQGEHDEALALLRWARARHLTDLWIHLELGWVLQQGKDKSPVVLEQAMGCYRTALALRPAASAAHVNLGLLLDKTNQLDEAMAEYRQAIDVEPKNARAHENLGNALRDKNQLDEAIAEYRKAIDLEPKSARAHNNLGLVLRDRNQLDEASAEFRKAIELDTKLALAHYNLGLVLRDRNQLDEASAEFRQAIDLQPDYAEAHCTLGQILRLQGQLSASLDFYKRGHALGSKRKDWPYPSAQMVADAERLVGLEAKLPDVLAGKATPANNRERLGLIEVCQLKRRHVAAARLYADAFTADPKLADDLNACHRYNAACYAALAAAGQGTDAGKLDDQEQSRLRQQALAWLRADLEQWSKGLEGGKPEDRQVMRATLEHWQGDTDLAGVRDPQALKKLSAEEQEAWRKLWADVAELLKKVADAK